jgi:autotransporter-associated beta strand protein
MRPAVFRHFGSLVIGLAALMAACPQAASAATWTFLVYGDSRDSSGGINTQILGELAARTVAENPAFILFVGDLAGTGSQANYDLWKSTMAAVYNAGIGVAPVAGNHESAAFAAFKSTFITPLSSTFKNAPLQNFVLDTSGSDGRSFSFNYKNALFLGLDNYANNSTSTHAVNQTFVDARLAARNPAATPLVFAYCHEPAFKPGQDTGLENKSSARNTFWTSLQNAGCRQLYVGHDHLYADARLDNGDGNVNNDVHQLVVGTAGAPLYTLAYSGDTGSWTVVPVNGESQYGYERVVVNDVAAKVTETWVHRTGTNAYADTTNIFSYYYGPATTIWSGAAGNANLNNADNWQGGTLPNLTGGTAVLSFAAGGGSAAVNTAANLAGIVVNRDGDFTIGHASGGSLTIGGSGVVASSGGTTSRTYTLSQDIVMSGAQTWRTTNANSKLLVSGSIANGGSLLTVEAFDNANGAVAITRGISGNGGLTKIGSGALTLSGTDSYTGLTTVSDGKLIVSSRFGLRDGANLAVGAQVSLLPDPPMEDAEAIGPPVSAPTAATVFTVPEPGTLALLTVAALAGLYGRRYRP